MLLHSEHPDANRTPKSTESKQKDCSDLFLPQMKRHAELIGKGVDSRTALEMAFGKKQADEAYRIIAEIKKEKLIPNPISQ